jgi:alpha,alpha-trehalase
MPIRPETEMEGPAPPAIALPTKRGSSDELGVYDDARTYYTAEERHRIHRAGPRTRTYSQVRDGVLRNATWSGHWLTRRAEQNSLVKQMERMGLHEPYRRGSHGMDNPLN